MSGTFFGTVVGTEARDRRRTTDLNVGDVFLPDGPEEKSFSPQGGVSLCHVSDASRFRAILAVISNESRWDNALAGAKGLSLVLSLDSLTLPWARSTRLKRAARAATP